MIVNLEQKIKAIVAYFKRTLLSFTSRH